MIANDKSLLERALAEETRMMQRQMLLKQLWKLSRTGQGKRRRDAATAGPISNSAAKR